MDWLANVLLLTLVILGIVVVSLVLTLLDRQTQRQRLRRLAAERQAESHCRFAHSLDDRRLDTKVIRAVYETLQDHLRFVSPSFPVRARDDLVQD